MKGKKIYPETKPPHWFAFHTSASRRWFVFVGLVPVLFPSLIFYPVDILRLISVSLVLGFMFEFVSGYFSKSKPDFFDGRFFFLTVAFALSLPPRTPEAVAAVGLFFVLIIGKNLFGGWEEAIFQPVLIGRAAVCLFFPDLVVRSFQYFDESLAVSAKSIFWQLIGPSSLALGEMCALGGLVGGIFLIFRRVIPWQVPVFFLGTIAVLSGALGGELSMRLAFSGGVVFCGFFLMTDATCPLTLRGRILFSTGAGILVVAFRFFLTYYESTTYAILLMNSVTPLIDRHFFIRPKEVAL